MTVTLFVPSEFVLPSFSDSDALPSAICSRSGTATSSTLSFDAAFAKTRRAASVETWKEAKADPFAKGPSF